VLPATKDDVPLAPDPSSVSAATTSKTRTSHVVQFHVEVVPTSVSATNQVGAPRKRLVLILRGIIVPKAHSAYCLRTVRDAPLTSS
jgi:hypothetical protein